VVFSAGGDGVRSLPEFLKTAKALGLAFPFALLGCADDVIGVTFANDRFWHEVSMPHRAGLRLLSGEDRTLGKRSLLGGF
jgi:hypothetical protein